MFNGDWRQPRCQHFCGDANPDRTAIARQAADAYCDCIVEEIAQLARPSDTRWHTHEEIQCKTCAGDLCHSLLSRAVQNAFADEIDEVLSSESEGEEIDWSKEAKKCIKQANGFFIQEGRLEKQLTVLVVTQPVDALNQNIQHLDECG